MGWRLGRVKRNTSHEPASFPAVSAQQQQLCTFALKLNAQEATGGSLELAPRSKLEVKAWLARQSQ